MPPILRARGKNVSEYNAESIKILTAREVSESQPWVKAETLAKDYGQDIDFVRRLLEVCAITFWPVDQAIARYLEGDKTIEVPLEVMTVHRELAEKAARGFHRERICE
jgi:hypothetical protein